MWIILTSASTSNNLADTEFKVNFQGWPGIFWVLVNRVFHNKRKILRIPFLKYPPPKVKDVSNKTCRLIDVWFFRVYAPSLSLRQAVSVKTDTVQFLLHVKFEQLTIKLKCSWNCLAETFKTIFNQNLSMFQKWRILTGGRKWSAGVHYK